MSAANVSSGYKWLIDPYAFLDDALAHQGLTFRVNLPVLGRSLVTGDPDLIREVVQSPDLDAGQGIIALRTILGDRSLITLDGSAHRDRRRFIAPQFGSDRIKSYDAITIEKTLRAIQQLPKDNVFSIYDLVRKISLQIIIRVIFGPKDREDERQVEILVEDFLASFGNPLVLFLKPLQKDFGRFSPWGRAVRNRQRLRAYILEQTHACREADARGISLLSEIVQQSERPAEDELTTELLTLLMFGHDTGAATMAWAFAHLYQHPEAIERVKLEAETIKTQTGRLAPERHHYLEACLKESMRLCPAVVHLTRVANRDTQIGDYPVKEGQRVLPCTYLAQHNPEVFPDPYRFKPERFSNGQDYKHSYFPFGFGSRTCIGESFAMRQMILIVSTIVSAALLDLVPGYQIRPERRMVLIIPRKGTRMVVRHSWDSDECRKGS